MAKICSSNNMLGMGEITTVKDIYKFFSHGLYILTWTQQIKFKSVQIKQERDCVQW